MAKKITRSAGAKYLLEGLPGDNPKLMAQVLTDGRESLYLEYYLGAERTVSASGREYTKARRSTDRLGLFLWSDPRTQKEKQSNRDVLEVARKIRYERAQELLENAQGHRLRSSDSVDLLAWLETYEVTYTKRDAKVIRQARKRFLDYLTDTPKYSHFARRLPPAQLTRGMCEGFADFLRAHHRGEGPHTIFARFKKMIRAAHKANILRALPTADVSISRDANAVRKDILSMAEIQRLFSTPEVCQENPNIRRAFMFSLYTGIRYCDVRALTYAHVDRENRLLRFEQMKVAGHSSASLVTLPLTDFLLDLIGEGRRSDLIFPLPSHNMCLKALRRWIARAGIDKHITWHCARHSFAVNILNNGANIKTLSTLLGHTSVRMTDKYLQVVDTLRLAALTSLPTPTSVADAPAPPTKQSAASPGVVDAPTDTPTP